MIRDFESSLKLLKTEIQTSFRPVGDEIEDKRDRRALVIDGNPANRRIICEVLSRKGYEVSACDSLSEGRKFFRAQPLVVAGCVDVNGEVAPFVEYVRETAGDAQPYIITLEDAESGGGAPVEGGNDVLSTPVDGEDLELKLKAAQAWLAGRPAKLSGGEMVGLSEEDGDDTWKELADFAEDVEAATDHGDPEPLFDAETAELAIELLDQDPASDVHDIVEGDEVRAAEELTDDPVLDEEPPAADPLDVMPEAGEPVIRVRRGSGKVARGERRGAATRYHLQLMLEACPVAMAMFDGSMKYLFANSPWRRGFGLDEPGLAGRSHFEIFSEVSERWQLLCERCLSEADEQTGEELVEWADGGRDWVRWIMRPWYLDDGVVGGIVVSAQSITGEKRSQREQRFESDVTEAAMASPSNPLVVLDAHGRIVRSNRVAKRLGRWDPAGEGDVYYWEAFLRKGKRREAQEQFMEFARRLLDSGEFGFPDTSVEEVVGHDGKSRRVVWTNSPRRSDDGDINGVVRVGFDLERFEDPTKDDELRNSVLHELPVPGWRCDAAGKIDMVNGAWLTLRGRSLEEELENGWMDGLSEGDIDPITDALSAAATGRVAFSKVVRLAGADGQTRWMRFSAAPSDCADKVHVFGMAQDVTAEHELDASHGEAQRMKEAADASATKAARFEADLAALGVELNRLRADSEGAAMERDRFRSIPESAPFGIVLLGRDGKMVYCNPAHAEVAGSDIGAEASIEDWLAKRSPEPGEAQNLVEEWRAKVWRQGTTAVFPIATSDGSVRELEFRPKLMADGGLLVTIFDVTDTRRGEEALRASEAKFRALFYDSGVGMALADRAGQIFDSNPALESLLGYNKVEMRGRPVDEFLSADGASELASLLGTLAGGGGRSGELVVDLATGDGEQITAHMHVSQVKAKDGSVLFTTYFFHDISEQLRTEAGLEEQQAENRALLGASPDMIVVIDRDGRLVDLIPPIDFSLKVDREGALGHLVEEVLPEFGISGSELNRKAGSEGVFNHHFRTAGGGGGNHYELRASRSGERNTVVLVRDVTLVNKAQNKLKWQALTFAHISDAIVVTDMKGRVIDWNPAAEQLFGYPKAAAVGMGLHEIYGGADPGAFRDEFTSAIRSKHRWASTVEFSGSGGKRGKCESVFVPLQDEDGAPLALVGVNSAVVEAPPAPAPERIVERVVEIDESAADRARSEMQNRLNATLKTISTLLGLQAQGAGANTASAGKARVDALALLHSHVGEDGDFRSVDFGRYLHDLVGELLETEAPEETDVEVHLNAKGVVLPAGLAMPVALIANELLANAFRHGCAGRQEVVVALAMEVDEAKRQGVLAVRDSGRALPPGFSVAGAGGLGLRIVKGLVERIGGTVEVGSSPETEFRVGFRLPPGG